tara:strand:+ start:188 stop:352 length:165 start_codon:yes stop_codon:yes gene_type:complete
MKTLTIVCKSSDNDDEFQNELNIISKQLAEGCQSGFDANETNFYRYSIETTPPD